LDELGFDWDPLETDWAKGLHHLTIYKEREGHCRVPRPHEENGFRLGHWVNNQRHKALAAPRRQQLDELGFDWDPLETDWAEGLRCLTIYKEREGHCRVSQKHMENGFCLGSWVNRRRASKDREILPEARRQQLDELGFDWDPLETDWAEGLHHLTIYKEREGHCRVSQKHMENGFRLGIWVANWRKRMRTLSEARRQQLDELGFEWDPLETDWVEGFRYLIIYKEREGHCRVPKKLMENGFPLGQWVGWQRHKADTLSAPRRQLLDGLGFVWDPFETDWSEGLRYLRIYKEREGHCRVPAGHKENGFSLGQWVGVQRYNADTLSAPRRQQLDELGFDWDPLETDWAKGLQHLTIYKERVGHCRVPDRHKENGFSLGQWVGVQRYNADTLSAPRRQLLDGLGFVWDPFETDWAEGLRYLRIYKEREGHCRVPRPHRENGFLLGDWVNTQRHKALSAPRRQQLDELGFEWDPLETDWAEGLHHLTIYKEREGHCRVPHSHRERGFRLGIWAANWRIRKQTLPEARRQQLDELGFIWDPFETDWAEGFRYLTIYKEREGHCRVPLSHKENGFRLGRWVNNQRHRKQTLSGARRQQLDGLGFVWDPHETDWAEGFRYLTIYKEREGHCRVPRSYKENGFRLGEWVHNQRHKKYTLSGARRQQLDGLGFVWDVRRLLGKESAAADPPLKPQGD
jgi:hypothetical protein